MRNKSVKHHLFLLVGIRWWSLQTLVCMRQKKKAKQDKEEERKKMLLNGHETWSNDNQIGYRWRYLIDGFAQIRINY